MHLIKFSLGLCKRLSKVHVTPPMFQMVLHYRRISTLRTELADKDATEGRCPACRTLYNKEKIVGTVASCERLVSEMNVEKKLKSHKGKSKSSEGKKQLASVRVIQRNFVYDVGLPLSFVDEDAEKNELRDEKQRLKAE